MAKMPIVLTQMPPKLPQNQLSATQNATIGSQNATKLRPLPHQKCTLSTVSEGKINHRGISQWQ